MQMENHSIIVQDAKIRTIYINGADYISLVDLMREFGYNQSFDDESEQIFYYDTFLLRWLKQRHTVWFLSVWERIHNPTFNIIQAVRIKSEVADNGYVLTPQRWSEATNAIGFYVKTEDDTYAHHEIAFDFGAWLSPEFKMYLFRKLQYFLPNMTLEFQQSLRFQRSMKTELSLILKHMKKV
jgi:hypothetical protein